MSKPPKAKTRGANVPVPQSREEAASFIHDIGVRQREIARIEADMNDRIAQAKKDAEAVATPLREQVERFTEGLRNWAEAHRAALTENGKRKFADLGTGKIEWRLAPPRVSIRGVDEVIGRIKTLGLSVFLRTKEEIDKEAMLREPEKARLIAGVSIGTAGENFSVEPFEAEIKGAAE
ncbi:host-nuclease inhibitor Gam family protein [Methylocystis sp. H4A]|uniref:Host-nuclease inhibitor protein Gam n=1 Tax=Methylocystis rosea TaxID=173366 RepID=A0ABX6EIV6_9HYPH|nr:MULTISPECIES: host-nuclease inhibitor Gam family protein [Methylocystis]MBG0802861.1 host-nuclease inhibitor Gam family protein [Methylocystis sp. H4A]QGM93802.1 host-nuclease inhibitor protein Gam [Methylocystis rosea]